MSKDLSGISSQEFWQLQKKIDVEKWLASERAGRDLCGSMSWCVYCIKAEEYPCAKAQFREKLDRALDDVVDDIIENQERVAEVMPAENEADMRKDEGNAVSQEQVSFSMMENKPDKRRKKRKIIEVPEGYQLVTRYRRSFRARLIQSVALQDLYTEIKNSLLGLSGIKSRIGQNGENFKSGKQRIAKLCISGKTLSLFLSLDPGLYENSPYRVEDMSDRKTHANTPLRIKITGKRTLKQAKMLLQDLAEKYDLINVGSLFSDFHYAYQDDEYLIRKGLIRPYQVLVKKRSKTDAIKTE